MWVDNFHGYNHCFQEKNKLEIKWGLKNVFKYFLLIVFYLKNSDDDVHISL